MNINETDVAVAEIDREKGRVFGRVTFFFDVPGEPDRGTANFECAAPIGDDVSRARIWGALVREACRQVSRMPEYLMGQRTLTFANGMKPG